MRYLVLFFSVAIILIQGGCATDSGSKDGPMNFPGQQNPDLIPDAKPRSEPLSRYGNPNHYEVYGKRYYVQKSSQGFRQEGVASWYGKQFHGRRTSSGETYDMFAMTAAHKTLPLPTYVRVVNQKNGRSIMVRVNDRGPFHSNRIIDLSYAAALKLGIVGTGTAPVAIEAIHNQADSEIEQTQELKLLGQQVMSHHQYNLDQHDKSVAQNQFVQLGVFAQINNAKQLQQKILHSSLPTPDIMTVTINDADLYRVVIGPVNTESQLQAVNSQLDEMGIQHQKLITSSMP